MIPYKTIIKLNRESKQALYIQLTNQFIELIKNGTLVKKNKLPSSRQLSELIGLHRKTVVACYEELDLQGWIQTLPKKGTFVNEKLPLLKTQKIGDNTNRDEKGKVGFPFKKRPVLDRSFPNAFDDDYMYVNDGISDGRLAPINEIAMLYRKLATKKHTISHFGYGTTYGNMDLTN